MFIVRLIGTEPLSFISETFCQIATIYNCERYSKMQAEFPAIPIIVHACFGSADQLMQMRPAHL